MATIKKFTDTVVKALKVASKEQDYLEAESKGFGIRVSPSGLKKFFYRYNVGKKRRFIQLGHYKQSETTTGIALAEARRRYVEARNKVLVGGDPATEKIKAQVVRTRTPFIADLVTDYIKYLRDKKKIRSWKESERALLRDFVPVYGQLKITDLERRDVQALLSNIADTGSPVMANRLQAYISSLLSYAFNEDIIPINYMLRVKKVGGTEEAKTRNLSFEEVKTFWKKLDKAKAGAVYKIALKLILLTGQRPSEVCGIHKNEIDGDWWTIPASRMKSGLDHMVYLSPLAKKLLKHDWCKESDYLLHQVESKDKCITKDVLANQLGSIVDSLSVDKFTPHDLRRTMASRIAGMRVSQDMIDRIQGRVAGAKRGAGWIYNRYDYAEEKQEVMLNYDNKLQRLLGMIRETYPDWHDPNNPEDTGII